MSERTVLIVEDEADILMSLRIALELADYRVLGVASAEEALTVFDREAPDAMLLDIGLPGMDGWTLLEQLQSDTRRSTLPVIVVSAHADLASAGRATQLGCRAFLTKPFRVAELTRALDEVFAS